MNRSIRNPFAHALQAALAALAACALTAAPAAAWTSNPALNTPICTALDNQSSPVTVPDGLGGVFIAWHDSRTSGNDGDLYIQRLDVKGNPLWGANGTVLCDAPFNQSNPRLLADGTGGVWAAWGDLRGDGSTRDVYAQRLDASGTPLWTANGVPVCTSPNHQLNVQIERGAAALDELILVWEDWRNATSDIYAQGLTGDGAIRWTANGVPIANAAGDQKRPVVVSDGASGVIIAWQDFRSGVSLDAYAQRFVFGQIYWAGGVALCTLAGNQQNIVGTSDGSGGAIFAWDDDRAGAGNHDIYGQRVDIVGTKLWGTQGVVIDNGALSMFSLDIAPDGSHGAYVVWAEGDIRAQRMLGNGSRLVVGGIAICIAASTQSAPRIATDGNGGAFITWYDQRSGEADIYANRLLPSGLPWGSDGIPIGTATLTQYFPTLAADGRGAAIVAWGDARTGNTSVALDIYAQRIDRFAALGEPEPAITSLTDVPGDEGGNLALGWSASPLVTPGNVGSYSYRLWRATPVAGGALTTGGDARMARATTSDPDAAALAGGPLFESAFSASSTAWEWVATIPADVSPSYSLAVPTAYDSLPGPNPPPTQYMVELRGGPSGGSRFSLPDSARSVDNLAPAAPAPFTGEFVASEAHLHWDPNAEPDFKVYILHRGDAPGFTPTVLTYIATLTDTGYVDVTGEAHVYKIFAVDVHGNTSPASEIVLGGTVDVPAQGASLAFLGPVAPNPTRGDVTLRFGLPHASQASLEVFDTSGRRVRALAQGELAAGEHFVRWDGRDASGGRCPAGMYFVRMQAVGFRAERRLVLTR